MQLSENLKIGCESVLDLLLPRMCSGCGRPLARTEQFVCPRCLMQLDRDTEWDWQNNRRILLWREHKALQRMGAFAFFRRKSIAANMVHELKYHGQHNLGVWMGRLAATELRDSGLFDGVERLVPIPLTWRRRLHRGFNQAERIAAGMSQVLDIPVETGALRRLRNRESQTHFTLRQRVDNASNIFGLTKNAGQLAANKHVMLVDDVMTTGTTMLSAIQAMETLPGIRLSAFAWSWVHLPEILTIDTCRYRVNR